MPDADTTRGCIPTIPGASAGGAACRWIPGSLEEARGEAPCAHLTPDEACVVVQHVQHQSGGSPGHHHAARRQHRAGHQYERLQPGERGRVEVLGESLYVG